MDFFLRDKDFLIPIEVKDGDNSMPSLNNLIGNVKKNKLCDKILILMINYTIDVSCFEISKRKKLKGLAILRKVWYYK